ncbi:hypothetical protein D6825_02315 [Candidatus Woesearchaeota archaeon]|nr:MAG: hypothetical protein D6825_02315 [Candidatus Woesearchaeota archaeon]
MVKVIDRAVLFLSLAVLLLFVPLAYLHGTDGFAVDALIFAALSVFFFSTRRVWNLSTPVFIMLVLGFTLHLCGVFGWYYKSPIPVQWDHVTHLFGLMGYALLFAGFAQDWLSVKWSRKNFAIVLMVFLAAFGIGALIELSEFLGYLKLGFGDGGLMFGAGDGLPGSDVIEDIGGGWINTGWDLIYNFIGVSLGLMVWFASRAFVRKPRTAYYFEQPSTFSKRL